MVEGILLLSISQFDDIQQNDQGLQKHEQEPYKHVFEVFELVLHAMLFSVKMVFAELIKEQVVTVVWLAVEMNNVSKESLEECL